MDIFQVWDRSVFANDDLILTGVCLGAGNFDQFIAVAAIFRLMLKSDKMKMKNISGKMK
ncbi:hypothetical protein [Maridesulfovibrio hydrothermalis]|uniref:hypothetical protein n=1 Tax=Maridesulfovibrio hydrothermalis TaxID=191026 RepID=UPI00030F428A|nr:hypothetical protein [Maridesulfovibrio hydrothermalis]